MICPHCQKPFEPRRADQRYCKSSCRQAHYAATIGDGGLRGAVRAVRVVKGGITSVTVHFPAQDRHNALQLTPGQTVEVVG